MIDVTRETFAYYISGESAVGIPPRVSADMLRAYDRLRAENEQLRRERDAERTRQEERVRVLEEALRRADCPRPCNGRPDDFEVGQCVDAGECGCCLGDPLLTPEMRAALGNGGGDA